MNPPIVQKWLPFVMIAALLLIGGLLRLRQPSQAAAGEPPADAAATAESAARSNGSALFSSASSAMVSAADTVQQSMQSAFSPEDIPSHLDTLPASETAPATQSTRSPCAGRQDLADDENHPIVIGAILPLSSPGAFDAGFVMQFALNTAAKVVNAQGGVHGRPVRLITYDSAGIPRRGAMYAERLITLDCAAVIVGLYHDNVALAVLETAEAHGTPVIIAGARDERLTAGRSPVVFRIIPTEMMREASRVAFLLDRFTAEPAQYWRDGEATVFYITENSPQAAQRAAAAIERMQAVDISAEHLPVDVPTDDFAPTIARIVASEMLPDAVIVALPEAETVDFCAQLADAGIGAATGTFLILDAGSRGLDGAHARDDEEKSTMLFGWDGPVDATVSEAGRPLVQEFAGYFSRWPEPLAFSAFDSLLLATDALRRADSLIGPDVVDALEATDIDLASGRYTFPVSAAAAPEDAPVDGAGLDDTAWHQWLEPQLLLLNGTIDDGGPHGEIVWPPAYR